MESKVSPRRSIAAPAVLAVAITLMVATTSPAQAASCSVRVDAPYNSGSLIVGAARVERTPQGYPTMKVRLMKARSPWDQQVAYQSGTGVFGLRWRTAIDCAGTGMYYTKLTLDGHNSYSSRVNLNCGW
jgi:hypothetical protein